MGRYFVNLRLNSQPIEFVIGSLQGTFRFFMGKYFVDLRFSGGDLVLSRLFFQPLLRAACACSGVSFCMRLHVLFSYQALMGT